MNRWISGFLALTGLAFLLIGANTFRDPQAAMRGVDLLLHSVSAVNEVRANYGGMQIGMGLFFLAGAWRPRLTRPALLALALFTGGLVAGRLISMALDGLPNSMVLALLLLEVVAASVALLFLLRRPSAV